MLNCKKASELASRAIDEKLPFWENMSLTMHLLLCRSCKHFTQQLSFLNKASHQAQTNNDFHLSGKAKQRMTKALKDEQFKNQKKQ